MMFAACSFRNDNFLSWPWSPGSISSSVFSSLMSWKIKAHLSVERERAAVQVLANGFEERLAKVAGLFRLIRHPSTSATSRPSLFGFTIVQPEIAISVSWPKIRFDIPSIGSFISLSPLIYLVWFLCHHQFLVRTSTLKPRQGSTFTTLPLTITPRR